MEGPMVKKSPLRKLIEDTVAEIFLSGSCARDALLNQASSGRTNIFWQLLLAQNIVETQYKEIINLQNLQRARLKSNARLKNGVKTQNALRKYYEVKMKRLLKNFAINGVSTRNMSSWENLALAHLRQPPARHILLH